MWKAWILSVFAASVASLVATNDAVASERDMSASPAVATSQESKAISLLGFDICFGDAATSCDVRLPALPRPTPPAKRITLLGKTLCVGGGSQTPGCDVRLPAMESTADHSLAGS